MYGIYSDIIGAAQRALECFKETEELLEYPEVQADKAEYLSVLSKYNHLKFLQDKLNELITALKEEKELHALLLGTVDENERAAIYDEIAVLKKTAFQASGSLSEALGCRHAEESAYCRFKLQEGSAKFGTALFSLIKAYLLANGAKVKNEKVEHAKGGYVREISFVAEGADVIARLSPVTGAHKVYFVQAKSEELCFAVTSSEAVEELNERDLKIDLFHSQGAGGQNVNKVETAVRVTHLPTGLVVVCQDERSQLKNKKRALETIEKRLKEKSVQAEKERIEADIRAQYSKKNTPISLDAGNNTFTDTRLKGFIKVAFPLTETQFTSYLNGLIAL